MPKKKTASKPGRSRSDRDIAKFAEMARDFMSTAEGAFAMSERFIAESRKGDKKILAALERLIAENKRENIDRDAWFEKTWARIDMWLSDDKKTRQRIEEAEEARGRAAEAMFRDALPAVLEKAGLKVSHVEPRRLRKRDREYDFVARNGKANFVGEVKVRFRAKHLSQLRGLLAKFREDYPEKAGRRAVYGIVCGLAVDEDAAAIARKEGLLVVEGKGAAKLRVKPRKIRDYAGG